MQEEEIEDDLFTEFVGTSPKKDEENAAEYLFKAEESC